MSRNRMLPSLPVILFWAIIATAVVMKVTDALAAYNALSFERQGVVLWWFFLGVSIAICAMLVWLYFDNVKLERSVRAIDAELQKRTKECDLLWSQLDPATIDQQLDELIIENDGLRLDLEASRKSARRIHRRAQKAESALRRATKIDPSVIEAKARRTCA